MDAAFCEAAGGALVPVPQVLFALLGPWVSLVLWVSVVSRAGRAALDPQAT